MRCIYVLCQRPKWHGLHIMMSHILNAAGPFARGWMLLRPCSPPRQQELAAAAVVLGRLATLLLSAPASTPRPRRSQRQRHSNRTHATSRIFTTAAGRLCRSDFRDRLRAACRHPHYKRPATASKHAPRPPPPSCEPIPAFENYQAKEVPCNSTISYSRTEGSVVYLCSSANPLPACVKSQY